MAETPVQTNNTVIDPMFAIPEGATDMEYGDANTSVAAKTQEIDEYTGLPVYGSFTGEAYENDGQNPAEPSAALETPSITSVVSQTLRRQAGGSNVVDIIIEVEDIPGAERYEIRIAKI